MTLTEYRHKLSTIKFYQKMRKRRETQKESLSSARATRGNMPQENNVAEQERMTNVMNKIDAILDGENTGDIIAAATAIILKAIKQQAGGNLFLARRIFKGVSNAFTEAFKETVLQELKNMVETAPENVDSLLKEFRDDLPQSNQDLLLRDAKDLFNGESAGEVEAVCMTILFDIALKRGEYNATKTILNLREMFGRAMKNAIESVKLLTHG